MMGEISTKCAKELPRRLSGSRLFTRTRNTLQHHDYSYHIICCKILRSLKLGSDIATYRRFNRDNHHNFDWKFGTTLLTAHRASFRRQLLLMWISDRNADEEIITVLQRHFSSSQ